MTNPATLGDARYCLRLMFDPMVKAKAAKCGSVDEAKQAATTWLAGEMGIPVEQCIIDGMTAAETWLAVNIIREWRQGKSKIRDAKHREQKKQRNEYYDRQRQLQA